MIDSLNRVQLIGTLKDKPSLKQPGKGKSMATFTIMTTEHFGKDDNGKIKSFTTQHRCIAWGKLSDTIAHLNSEDLLLVEGKIQHNKYTDKKGIERYSTQIAVHDAKVLGYGETSLKIIDDKRDKVKQEKYNAEHVKKGLFPWEVEVTDEEYDNSPMPWEKVDVKRKTTNPEDEEILKSFE